jgi:[acyl-carrier-protein] S-malonyltransferase
MGKRTLSLGDMTDFAFLFPGQASQSVGMGRDLYEESDLARAIFDEADEVVGTNLTRLCFSGPREALQQTAITQPAVFVHSVAAWRLLQAEGLEPACVAGHSLGEYSALVAVGALAYREGLELVKRRGQLMQQAGADCPGAMAALIGLDDEVVSTLCEQAGAVGTVVAANFNAPGQLVVSGEAAAVDHLQELAREAGARRVVKLDVSGAFHSPLMKPAARAMRSMLQEANIKKPRAPVITNVAARPIDDPEELRQQLIAQITQPVRWTESIRSLHGLGVERAAEVGPGTVLKGLVRRIQRRIQVFAAGTSADIAATAVELGKGES